MALFLEEITEILRSVGLDSEDQKRFRKFPPGPARRQARRVYIEVTLRPVSRIDVAGDFKDPAVVPIPPERARDEHRNSIRGEFDPTTMDDEACRELIERLGRWVFAAPPSPARSSSAHAPLDDDEDHPDEPLPIVDSAQLATWAANRLGYGSRRAGAWFLGMEEACERASELPDRIAGDDLEDLGACLQRLGYDWLLGDSPDLQRTWAPLIRAWLVATGRDTPTADDVRAYQRDHWGHNDGDTLLVELQPLPSPSTQRWPWTPLVGERGEFWAAHRDQRVALLREAWRSAPARVLVAYGKSYWPEYRAIADVDACSGQALLDADPGWAETYSANGRGVVLVRHPVRDNANDRWATLGRWLRTFVT